MKCAFSSVAGGRSMTCLCWIGRSTTLHAERPITTVIHGGAVGADTMAHFWAGAAAVPIDASLGQDQPMMGDRPEL
jgi:YspA, cpYpsA-related SLOG family